MRVQHALVLIIAVTFFAQSSPFAEDTHHSPGVVAKQEYLKAVPGVPDKVVRMTILEIPPDRVVDPHCHHGYEYGIVTQGTLMVKSGGGDYESKSEGDVFSVPPRTPMTVKNVTDKPAQLYSVLVVDEHGPFVDYLDGRNDCLKNWVCRLPPSSTASLRSEIANKQYREEHYSPRSGKFPAPSAALLPRLESAG